MKLTVKPKFITDHLGKKISVILTVNDFKPAFRFIGKKEIYS